MRSRPISLLLVVGFGVAVGLPALTAPVQAGPCDPPVTNPVACENSLPGDPASEWDIDGAGDPSIQGFATDISVDKGETVRFKVDTTATAYRFDIYRMGYYSGDGARKVASVNPSAPLPQNQPACIDESSTTGLIDCGSWAESGSWAVPSTAVSGIYFARLVRTDTGGASHIVFIVRDDASTSDLLFQTADTTWQAYNSYGGNSLYLGQPVGRAYKVSYNRPFNTRGITPWGRDFVFANEYPMVRWLEANGYDVTYTTGVDSDRRGELIKQHKVFLSVGHDEYWSGAQRAHVEAARNAGVHLAFFAGNAVYWKTRWESSVDGSGTPYRTLVTYKDTKNTTPLDPLYPSGVWTGTWRDPRFSPPADGGRPENGLMGTIFQVNSGTFEIQVPEAEGKLRLWRNTSVASLPAGAVATLGDDTLGYEWDEDRDNGFRPPGLVRLSSSTRDVPEYLLDYGTTVGPATATHNLTLYRAPSGALVFGAGTVQWSWGLDGDHDGEPSMTDASMRQATVNLFADMGVQPATLQAGLVAASASTDTTAPTATISAPANGSVLTNAAAVTVSGTAADSGGGRVGGVEVSTDGGTTWHPATGRETWTYPLSAVGAGPLTIKARAVDDSGNIGVPAAVDVTVECPCQIFSNSTVPQTPAVNDPVAIEVGVKFRSDVGAFVTGIRFYKGTGNTGTHVGNLWATDGTKLASATFTNETETGWQQVNFSTPVPIAANTTYVASYYTPSGRYAADASFFAAKGADSPPLHALQSGVDGENGVYRYGTGGGYPIDSYHAENYWVDVVVVTDDGPDTTPPSVVSRSPAPGATQVAVTTPVRAFFSEAVRADSISFVLRDAADTTVAASVTYDAAASAAVLTPAAALAASTTYTATVSGAADAAGNIMPAPDTWSFTTAAPAGECPCSIWGSTAVPANPSVNDAGAVELGVKLRADVDGSVAGIRFYKGTGNTGTHVGSLWSASGQRLASATFTNESETGWQQVNFATPVAITANTTYVASYHTTSGFYAGDNGFFQSAGVDNPPLHALASGVDGANGVYAYGAGGFPNQSYQASNYWVDVVFTTGSVPPADTAAPTVTATAPAAGATGVPTTSTVSAAFSEDVQPATVVLTLTGPDGGAVAGSLSYDSATRTATLAPHAALATGSPYTATVSGATDIAGNAMPAPLTWSFTTLAAAPSVTFADTTEADFGAGTFGAGATAAATGDGEVMLAPTAGSEFGGTALPSDWSAASYGTGGAVSLGGGLLAVNGARAGTTSTYGRNRSLEFTATLTADGGQSAGFAVDLVTTRWAIFTTGNDGSLSARSRAGRTARETVITGVASGSPHRFRIDWGSSSVVYSVDGAVKATHSISIGGSMRPLFADRTVGGDAVTVDWARMTPYATSGTFTSRVFDAGAATPWGPVSWSDDRPPGTGVVISVRTGDTAAPDASWSPWTTVASSGESAGRTSRYIQYQAALSTSDPSQAPALRDITLKGGT